MLGSRVRVQPVVGEGQGVGAERVADQDDLGPLPCLAIVVDDQAEIGGDLLRGLLRPEVAQAVHAHDRDTLGLQAAGDVLVDVAPAAVARVDHGHQPARRGDGQLDQRQPGQGIGSRSGERRLDQCHEALGQIAFGRGHQRVLDPGGGRERFGGLGLVRSGRHPPPARQGRRVVVETARIGRVERRARAERRLGRDTGREAVAGGTGECGVGRLGQRRIGDGRPHAGAGDDRGEIAAAPADGLDPSARLLEVAHQVEAGPALRILPCQERGQVDGHGDQPELGEPVCGRVELRCSTGKIGQQEYQADRIARGQQRLQRPQGQAVHARRVRRGRGRPRRRRGCERRYQDSHKALHRPSPCFHETTRHLARKAGLNR